MQQPTLKLIAIVLISSAFFAPVLGSFILDVKAGGTSQYSTIQLITMGFFNLPFIILAGACLQLGSRISRDRHPIAAKGLLIVSIISSIAGSALMISWGLGAKV